LGENISDWATAVIGAKPRRLSWLSENHSLGRLEAWVIEGTQNELAPTGPLNWIGSARGRPGKSAEKKWRISIEMADIVQQQKVNSGGSKL
jgi:hypothetical protein